MFWDSITTLLVRWIICYKTIHVKLHHQARVQTFEKKVANSSVFTKGGANLKKILFLGQKLGCKLSFGLND